MGLLLLIEGCVQVPIQNETIWGIRYPPGNGAVQAQTLTAGTTDLTEIKWQTAQEAINAQQEVLVCMSSSSFADWKSAIEILCSQGNYCTYPVQTGVNQTFLRLNNLKTTTKKESK